MNGVLRFGSLVSATALLCDCRLPLCSVYRVGIVALLLLLYDSADSMNVMDDVMWIVLCDQGRFGIER